MKLRYRLILFTLAFTAIVVVFALVLRRREPVYQGKPLSYWVIKVDQLEEYNGAPQDAVAAIRAIGPKAVPFLLAWTPHHGAQRPRFFEWCSQQFSQCFPNRNSEEMPSSSDVETAWWALGSDGKSAIPALARELNWPRRGLDDYSIWTSNAKAISYLGPDAVIPMLNVATNMEGQHELWEFLHNFGNLGTNGAPAVPGIIHWADNPDYWIRDGVVSALGGIGQRPDLSLPVILKALHDTNSMVRRDAADALGVFASDSDTVLPALITMLKESDWEAREGALSGLGHIRNKSEIVIPLIVPHVFEENSVVQRSAAYALRDLGTEAGFQSLLQESNAANVRAVIEQATKDILRQPTK